MENSLLRTNLITIVGRLVSCDMKPGNRKSDGAGYVSGKATVISNIGGVDNEFEINFTTSQTTKDGKESQLYLSYMKMPELIGKKVEISGELRESRFYSSKQEQMVSGLQLSGRFVKGVAETTTDVAKFEFAGFVIEELKERLTKNNEVYRYDISLGQSNYSGTGMSKITLNVNPADVEIVRGVKGYQVGQTVRVKGNLNFLVKTVTLEAKNEGGFGEAIVRTYTNKIHNFFITGGSAPITDVANGSYPMDVIKTLIAAYKANDVKLMDAAKNTSNHVAVESAPVITSRQTSLL